MSNSELYDVIIIGGFEMCEKFLEHARSYDLEILEKEVVTT